MWQQKSHKSWGEGASGHTVTARMIPRGTGGIEIAGVCVYVFMHACMDGCVFVCVCVCACMCMCVCVCVHLKLEVGMGDELCL